MGDPGTPGCSLCSEDPCECREPTLYRYARPPVQRCALCPGLREMVTRLTRERDEARRALNEACTWLREAAGHIHCARGLSAGCTERMRTCHDCETIRHVRQFLSQHSSP